MARFTKDAMLDEFKEIIFQYARGVSFATEPKAGYEILFEKIENDPDNYDHYIKFMSPESDAKSFSQSFSLDHFDSTKTIKQFYDYGILGVCEVPFENIIGATEWTFAYGLILDSSKSLLISESLNGEYVDANKCLFAARAFFARLVLDGAERVHLEGNSPPEDMLSISEVALLADLDERTVRNATSINATNRLETALAGSTICIPRLAAIEWLKNKRGFVPSTFGKSAFGNDFLERNSFVNASQAGEFVRMKREELNLDQSALSSADRVSLSKKDISNLESGKINISEKEFIRIGETLELDGELFALRMLEVVKQEEIQSLRTRMESRFHSIIKTGKNKGAVIKPHRYADGHYIVTKGGNKKANATIVQNEADLGHFVEQGYGIRMSAPGIAPSIHKAKTGDSEGEL
jgi:transcriptional regulator with XRE-family HTH domain